MSKNGHDWSISVFKDKTFKKTISGKGKQHSQQSIDQALKIARPDLVVWYENPYLKSIRQCLAGQPKPFSRNNIKKYLSQLGLSCNWTFVSHHKSHAAHFYDSGLDEAVILVIDSIGEFDCTSIWIGKDSKLKKVYSKSYPDSLGLFYSAMTDYVGMIPQQDEGKFEQLAKINKVDRNIVESIYNNLLQSVNMHKGVRGWISPNNNKGEIAASVQHVFELEVQYLLTKAKSYGYNNLILSGGCAFNRGIRTGLYDNWDNVYIPSNPSDASSSYTAVLAYLTER